MAKKKPKHTYKRLSKEARKEEYRRIIKGTIVPFYDDFDGEFITMLTPETILTVEKHYHNNMLFGWNIYADGTLLETKSTRKKALKFVEQLGRGI